MKNNSNFLDHLIERMDQLDSSSIQNYILKLSRKNGFFEAVFNTIKEGVFVLNYRREIQYANSAGVAMLGITEDVFGQRIDRYLRDVDWVRLMSADPEHWAKISRQEIEVFYPYHRYLSFYILPIVRENITEDELPSFSLILHDVTKVKTDTQKNIESQKVRAITMLAAGVAHELGNPLNSLNIHLQLLKRSLQNANSKNMEFPFDDAKKNVAIALEEVLRLDAIVNNFLSAVRPAPMLMEQINIKKLLSESINFMAKELQNKNIALNVNYENNLPPIMGDESQLKQAFYNIIKNGIQVMPDGGTLTINGNVGDDFLEIVFTDTGPGISADDISRIMEPYFSKNQDGTGLGLLIVDRIIRAHGGELGIESSINSGAVFTIRLPLHERRMRMLDAVPIEKLEE